MLKCYNKIFDEVVDIMEKHHYDEYTVVYVLRRKNKYNFYEVIDYCFNSKNFTQVLKHFEKTKILNEDVIFKMPLCCLIIELLPGKIEHHTNTIQLVEISNVYNETITTLKFFTDEIDTKNKVDFMFVNRLKKP